MSDESVFVKDESAVEAIRPRSIRELIGRRVADDVRAVVEHSFCADPQVVAELEAAKAELAEAEMLEAQKRNRESGPSRRFSEADPSAELRERVEALEAQAAEVSLPVRFQALAPQKWTEFTEYAQRNKLKPEQSDSELILESFLHFIDPETGKPDREATKDDLARLLPVLSRGEQGEAAAKLVKANTVGFDLPFSRRR